MPTGINRKTGITICARLKPTCAIVVSRSPRLSTHHRGVIGAKFCPSDLKRFQRLGREQLSRLEQSLRETLFVRIAKEGLQHLDVGFEAVWPEVAAHQLFSVLYVLHQPWQHGLQRAHLV